MEKTLKKIKEEAEKAIQAATDLNVLKEIEVEFLGRKGKLTEILKGLKDLAQEKKKEVGKLSNEIKTTLKETFKSRQTQFETEKLNADLATEFFDTTIPGAARQIGHIHPLSQLQKEVEEIFNNMGFSIMDGPEVESEQYCFNVLNIPPDHPARDMQDTFFIKDKDYPEHGRFVMRTQTSPVQVRTMEKYGAPLRVIVPGRTFRYEAIDAKHEMTFSQIEGLMIDKNISVAHLKGIITEVISQLYKVEAVTRIRPGYFPFVEPGLEFDFQCVLCKGEGCKTCKHEGWIEMGGSGMVHPNVLRAGGIDPNEYQGWAFGFGFERLAMMRYLIPEIRLFNSGDIRFTRQF